MPLPANSGDDPLIVEYEEHLENAEKRTEYANHQDLDYTLAVKKILKKQPGTFIIREFESGDRTYQEFIYVGKDRQIKRLQCKVVGEEYEVQGKRYESLPHVVLDPKYKEDLKIPFMKPVMKANSYDWELEQLNVSLEKIQSASPEELLELCVKGAPIKGLELLNAADELSKNIVPLMKDNPALGKTLHKLYDKAAEKFILEGKLEAAFRARALAALKVPFSEDHPLYHLDQQISIQKSKQLNPSFGAHFSGLVPVF